MIIRNIFFTIIVFFSGIGIITLSVGVHELYHVVQVKDLNISNSQLCVFQLENITYNPSGYFRYTYPATQAVEEEQMTKYSEVKAYLVSAIIIAIGAISILHFIFYPNEEKKKEARVTDWIEYRINKINGKV